MKQKRPAATVSAAVNRLLDKRQRQTVVNLMGDALIHRTTIQAVRYLLNLGIEAHDLRLEKERELFLNWDSQFFGNYAKKAMIDPDVAPPEQRKPGDTINWPERRES
jgi:hypothetical protein